MPTIIDSLVVKLGLDSSAYEKSKSKTDKGLDETGKKAEQTGKSLKTAGDDAGKGFEEAARSITKFLAIIGGTAAIKHFIIEMIDANSALSRFSRNLGSATSDVSAWGQAVEQAGGSANGLQGSLDNLSRAQTEMQLTGSTGILPYLAALGVAMTDAEGRARPVTDMLMDIGQALQARAPDRRTAFNMGRSMGIDEGTLNLILQGRKEVEIAIKRQKENMALTKQQGEEAERLKRAMVASTQSFVAFGRELLSRATPALEKLFSLFEDFGAWVSQNKEFVQAFLVAMASGLALVAAATTPINLTATAVLGLAAAIVSLWQDYQVWKRGGDSLIDWAKWEPGINKAIAGAKELKEIIADLLYVAIAGADALVKFFSGDFEGAKIAGRAFWEGRQREKSPAPPPSGPYKSSGGSDSAMSYFQSQGWSKEQAAGLAANFQRESNFNPAAVGDNGRAYGIGQWHPDRQAEFRRVFGKDIQGSSLDEQLAFAQYELTQGNERSAGAKLRGARTAREAGAIVSQHYERPADRTGEAMRRGNDAMAMMGSIRPTSSVSSNSTTNNKSVQATIGEVKVYTQATDANGIAKDMGKSMDHLFTSQVNYGLT